MTSDDTQPTQGHDESAIWLLAGLVNSAALPPGDVADLRRMDPRHPPAAFFKLEGLALDDRLPASPEAREAAETRWAAIVVCLAHLGNLNRRAGDDYSLTLGHALARANYAEGRFARLLQADAERLLDELPMLARFLRAKGIPVDFTLAARLLLSSGRERDNERVRRRLARDYYGTLARTDHH